MNLHCIFSITYEEGKLCNHMMEALHSYITNMNIITHLINMDEIQLLPLDGLMIHFVGDDPIFIEKINQHRNGNLIGCSADFLNKTLLKTSMHQIFKDNGINSLDKLTFNNKITSLDYKIVYSLSYPVIIKLDSGSNSMGMSNKSVVYNELDLINGVNELYDKYKLDIVVEKFLSGREFTVAVYKDMVFEPIERIYKNNGDKIYIPDSVSLEGLCEDEKLNQNIKDVVKKACAAVNCDSYCRVDVRCDENDNVYVLEINSVCSIGKNSYYELSVNAAGITMNDIFSLMLKN